MSGLFGIPTLVIGLILMLAGSSWFTGAHTVGVILVVASLVPLAVVLVLMVLAVIVAVLRS